MDLREPDEVRGVAAAGETFDIVMNWWIWILAARWGIRLVMIPIILRRRLPPITAIAWLGVIFFAPVVGVAAYILIGSNILGRRRRRRYQHLIRERRAERQICADNPNRVTDPRDPIMQQTQHVFGAPVLRGNDAQLLPGHDAYFNALCDDIAAAEHHIHMLYYIFQQDDTGRRVADALIDAAARGVHCRLLVDSAGSRGFVRRDGLAGQLRNGGVDVHAALPVSPFRRHLSRIDLRNHRKLAVIDGTCAYAGSHNVLDAMYPIRPPLQCFDCSARLTGPVVGQLQAVFAEDWAFETDKSLDPEDLFPHCPEDGDVQAQVVPSGPEHESHTFRRMMLTTINTARRSLMLTTPYFVPDEHSLMAISTAAHRGVDVHVIVGKRSDYSVVTAAGRSFFYRLLAAGVNVHIFQPGMLHAKTLTIDDSLALIGSANFDARSFVLNFELGVYLYGERITEQVREVQQHYLKQCVTVDQTQWHQRPSWQQYRDDAAALCAPLL